MHRSLRVAAAALAALLSAAGAVPAAEEKTTEKESQDVAIAAIDSFIQKQNVDKSQKQWKTQLAKPPKVEFDPKKTYYWDLETNLGKLRIKLLTQTAPMHASSTIYLTRLGFYDGVGFHRVIRDFMAQGGDPLGNGRGGPGYQYDGEFGPGPKHAKRGMLSMANAGPGTDGSQFFITFTATPFLDGRHTVFGEVVEGEQTLAAMEKLGRPRDPAPPSEPITIERASIHVE
jgi:cyclophilin family peptidyl-prolyl cis-trans isomerase